MSSVYFYLFIIFKFILSILSGFKVIFIFDIAKKHKLNRTIKNVHFLGLNASNLPNSNNPRNNYDLITWYILYSKDTKPINILHDVANKKYFSDYLGCKISYSLEPFKYIYGFKNRLKFVFWLTGAIIISIKDLIIGKWQHALILKEAINSKIVSLNNNYADIYLFHFSGQSYRPMWTYYLESKAVEVVCYFYSVSEQPMVSNFPVSVKYDFYLYNWPTSYFWDKFHLEMIQNNSLHNTKGIITGPIWFSDSNESLSIYNKPYIVVFDLPQYRKYFHFGTSTLTDYIEYNEGVYSHFLEDIILCAEELDILVVHKVKRDIGKRNVKNYSSLLKKLNMNKFYNSVSPGISPIKLIDKSVAVISMPFTSTAIFGRYRNKPSIYYDPSYWIRENDNGSHDIQIISGKENLKLWLYDILICKNS